ncbi:MAG: hypothetical protein P8L18_12975 [Verrucomicrobiota bacterium]|nr:hypothetical protein [Verrucomicrobiota bacterium]
MFKETSTTTFIGDLFQEREKRGGPAVVTNAMGAFFSWIGYFGLGFILDDLTL